MMVTEGDIGRDGAEFLRLCDHPDEMLSEYNARIDSLKDWLAEHAEDFRKAGESPFDTLAFHAFLCGWCAKAKHEKESQ